MFKFEKEDRKLIEDLVSGKKGKRAKRCNIIYNILKGIGSFVSVMAFVNFGITVSFALVVAFVAGGLFLFKVGIVNPANKDLEIEDLAKQELMLKVQSKLARDGVIIDGKSFKLERTAKLDYRQPVYFLETKLSEDGEVIEENKKYGDVGNVEKYIRCSDNNNKYICWLKIIRESIIEKKLLLDGSGYINRIVPVYSVGMLDESEAASIPREVMAQTAIYDGSKNKTRIKKR